MFKPVSIFIGLRYTRAKTRHHFISLISLVSTLGIALGVTVLITVLSVINGFDREIKKQIFDMVPPVTLNSMFGEINDWQSLQADIKSFSGIKGAAPFVNGQAMLTYENTSLPVMLVGILPDQENEVSALYQKMIQGKLANLIPNQFNMVMGEELAKKLNAKMGDNIIIATLQDSFSTSHITPHFTNIHIAGIFKAGGGALNFGSKIAFIHLNDAQKIFHLQNAVSGFHINIYDVYSAQAVSNMLQEQLSSNLRIWNWTDQLGDFFDNIRLTKTIMFFIFLLIITVAVFNLICTMVMVVKNKQADIAILRTLGATPKMILTIFVVQGSAIAFTGILLGTLGGLLLSYNISEFSTWIQTVSNTNLISSNIYFVNYLPAEIQWLDVWAIALAALLLSLMATLYPAWNASRLAPVEALNGG